MKKVFLLAVALVILGVTNTRADKFKIRNGKIYKAGQLFSGTYQVFDESGTLESSFEIVNGVENGKVIHYYTDRSVRETGNFNEGLKDGAWEKWSADGNKIGEASYLRGTKHGTWKVWDEKGTLRSEMHYDKGERTGTWKMWNESGQLISEKTY